MKTHPVLGILEESDLERARRRREGKCPVHGISLGLLVSDTRFMACMHQGCDYQRHRREGDVEVLP